MFNARWWAPENRLYIKWFLAWQPLPSALAWYAYNYVPDKAFELLHAGMFAAEM